MRDTVSENEILIFFKNTAFLSFYTTISLKLILQLNDNVHVHSNF